MKRLLLALGVALFSVTNLAQAERYVMITHSQGVDAFWPVLERGARDAAAAIDVDFEYLFVPSGDMADMARLIESATAGQPDGIIVSLPDKEALEGAIKGATGAGIPVITINSGLEYYEGVGALMHIGQPERVAGRASGARAKEEGVTGKALCLNNETYNRVLTDRCEGYFESLGQELNMIDVSIDMTQVKARTSAALQADPDIKALLAVHPNVCEQAAEAVKEVGAEVHLACFDLTPGIINLIREGRVAYTIDQQQYLQGYMPVIILHLYNNNAGMLPGANIVSGPGFVDKDNADKVAELAGVTR